TSWKKADSTLQRPHPSRKSSCASSRSSRACYDRDRSPDATIAVPEIHMRHFIAVAALILSSLSATGAQADVHASVVATDPPGAVIELARNQSLYVRIEYATDRPISIWARPYFNGKEVSARSNASVPHAGSGEALGWFEFNGPAEVDEIRI